jgi:V8-like Glu-specific endopeptidase
MAYLDPGEVNDLSVAIASATDPIANRGALYQSVDPRVMMVMPIGGGAILPKLMTEIAFMNNLERITTGQVPLQIFLQNAALLVSVVPASEKTVRLLLEKVIQLSSGAPPINIALAPIINQTFIHRDDMVTFSFVDNALKTANSVFKLRIPAMENGQPRLDQSGSPLQFLGTGWLLTDSLLITNHHVINARQDGEGEAAEPDLLLQGSGAGVISDYNVEGAAENLPVQAIKLEAWQKSLDYAVIRIPPSGRTPLRRNPVIMQVQQDPIPVNIVQHPGGRSKRYGIRNNLVYASTPETLCYFTDTESGSSGAPVLNDKWEVVALHRGAKYVTGVRFQGKDTAYVNVGTHLKLIIDDIQQRYPALANEILQG